MRWSAPLQIKGELCGMTLTMDAHTEWNDQTFALTLNLARCISRLDYGQNAIHNNPLDSPYGFPPGFIFGPHYHPWTENKQFRTMNSLPENLELARLF